MIILPEIKKIAGAVAKIDRLSNRLEKKTDLTGVWWNGAYLVSGCTEKKGHLYQSGGRLDNCGLVDDLYYCDQHTGYCEDENSEVYSDVFYIEADVVCYIVVNRRANDG